MSEEKMRTEIINLIFTLEYKFDEIGKMFRDLARLLIRLKEAEGDV